MSVTMSDLKVYESLTIVRIEGFEPETEEIDGHKVPVGGDVIDPPGSANWLCGGYGQTPYPSEIGPDDDCGGILWSDYESSNDQEFSVLIASDEVESLRDFAREAGYTVLDVSPVTGPTNFGDGNGTCEVLKHRDGWVILES